jgi:hypothetical protein
MDSCTEAARLKNLYLAALSAFDEVQFRMLKDLRHDDPEFVEIMERREIAHAHLMRTR